MEDREQFHEFVKRHARGTLNDEVTMALAEVAASVSDLEKKGSVVVTIVVEPAGSGGRTVAIGAKVEAKLPKPDPELAVAYVGDGGSLHRDDPYQTKLDDAKRVEQDASAPKRIDEGDEG